MTAFFAYLEPSLQTKRSAALEGIEVVTTAVIFATAARLYAAWEIREKTRTDKTRANRLDVFCQRRTPQNRVYLSFGCTAAGGAQLAAPPG